MIPKEAVQDALPLAAAALYLALISTLITLVVHSFHRRLQTHARYASWAVLSLFTLFTILSLAIPTYHRWIYFAALYRNWHLNTHVSASIHHLHQQTLDVTYRPPVFGPHLSEWLSSDKPWIGVLIAGSSSPERVWWTSQRGFAATAWSLFVAVQGNHRGVPYLWSYLLLAHLTGSVSFTVNLFFLAILLHPLSSPPTPPRRPTFMPMWLPQTYTTLFALSGLGIYARQSLTGSTPAFAVAWLLPNIFAYVPLYVFPKDADEARCRETLEYWTRLYSFILLGGFAGHIVAWREVVYQVMEDSAEFDVPRGVLEAILEVIWPPPGRNGLVAALGWDVLLIGLSAGVWMGMRGRRWVLPVVAKRGVKGWLGSGVTGWLLMVIASVSVVAGGFAGELDSVGVAAAVRDVM